MRSNFGFEVNCCVVKEGHVFQSGPKKLIQYLDSYFEGQN